MGEQQQLEPPPKGTRPAPPSAPRGAPRGAHGEVTVQDVIRVGRRTDINSRDGLENVGWSVCEHGERFLAVVCLGRGGGGLWS